LLPNFDRDLVATYLRPHRPRLVLLAGLLAVGIALQLINPQLVRLLVDGASTGAPTSRLLRLAAVFLVVALCTQVATVAETYVAEDVGWRTTNALRADLTRHVLALDDGFHAEHGPGELIERIDGDVAAIAGFFARFVVHVVGSGLFLLGVLVLLWIEDARVGALLTVCSVAALAFLLRGGGFVAERSRQAREVSADLSAFLEERLVALPDLKANGADGYALRGLLERLRDRFESGRRAVLASSVFADTVSGLFVLGAGAALATSVLLLRDGSMTIGGVFLVLRYTSMLRLPLERLSRHLNAFQQAAGAIVRVRELLATEPRVVDGPGPRRPLPAGALAVELEDVSFAYEAADGDVLRDVSWRLEPGEVLGLLGRTGSGKTTTSRLLFRLHDATSGTVRLGGVDVRDVPLADLRRRVAMVTQDVQLFAGTLRDNVTLFDAAVDDATLEEVFGALGIEAWLDDLPDGLDTVLGATGRGLSAGESQLVALARVFLEDPGLVVLDEASSRLDPHTEELLERAISRLLDGRTAIVIAHRLATVARADRICVLDGGRVVELGERVALAADDRSRFAHLLRVGRGEVLA
jgi:ABC-type multidrug transport system fused ATPase/permease subunit